MEVFEEISSTFGDTSDLIARCKDEFGIDLLAEVHSVAPKEREGA